MVRRSSPRGGYAMSPSTRSKPVSETSPVTGGEPDPAASKPAADPAGGPGDTAMRGEAPHPGGDASTVAAGGARPGSPGMRPTRIELEVSRQRSVSWTILGVILGVLLI